MSPVFQIEFDNCFVFYDRVCAFVEWFNCKIFGRRLKGLCICNDCTMEYLDVDCILCSMALL